MSPDPDTDDPTISLTDEDLRQIAERGITYLYELGYSAEHLEGLPDYVLPMMFDLASRPIHGTEDDQTAKSEKVEPPPAPVSPYPLKPWGAPSGEVAIAQGMPALHGWGERSVGVFVLPSGARLPYHYVVGPDALLLENPKNEQPGPAHPETLAYVEKVTLDYHPERQFMRDLTLVHGPPVTSREPGTTFNVLWGGHRTVQVIRKNRPAYQAEMPKHLDAFGLDPAFIDIIKEAGGQPALYIEFDDPVPSELHAELLRALNERER